MTCPAQVGLKAMNVDRIASALKTSYNAEDGLSIDASKRLYARMIADSPAFSGFKDEVEVALSDPAVSWRALLCCADYEVLATETEEEARAVARVLLLDPLGA